MFTFLLNSHVHMKVSEQNVINPFCFTEKLTSVFHCVNGNFYEILEYLKNPTLKQMVAEL